MGITTNLNKSITALKNAIADLKTRAAFHYTAGDNLRGNIRNDAANRLQGDLDRLAIGVDYIILALKK